MKEIKDFPRCSSVECFACEEGHCLILTNNKFKGKPCPFFKTKEQVLNEQARCKERLANIKKGV